MATTEKPSRANERPMLAVVVVLPTPPLPDVMTTTLGSGVLVKERKLHKNMFDVLKGEEDGSGIEKGN
ncbi:hypothetical protein H5410_016905 [Solanum commersonii]|uniref:Uncharacterized protein n=1 Tax=Solanum commersonii TaxID=4109 RepID=A0A9J5ZXT3_SOLCO|nr:hypothetical protein H5410_016905 [Solanum commersonii]